MTKVIAVIPARYASTRFPGKPLAELLGRPMIQWVYEAVSRAKSIQQVIVATDDPRIFDGVRSFGGEVVMTRNDHRTGTDRMAEVAASHTADLYVNVQGDEPLLDPGELDSLVDLTLGGSDIDVGTACFPISALDAQNPNRVKVVLAGDGRALYFSRSPIPYARHPTYASYLQHVGVYAFKCEVLQRFPTLSEAPAERAESLEQLRLLHAGFSICVMQTRGATPGVDTEEDLKRVEALLSEANRGETPSR